MAVASRVPVTFLLDVDNTLLDNDRVTADLRRYMELELGAECQTLRMWREHVPRRVSYLVSLPKENP